MNRFIAILMALGFLTLASPALAGNSDLIAGLNGVATSGLDPVFGVITGDDTILPSLGFADPVATRVVGLVTGTVEGFIRAATGSFDAATFLFTAEVGGPYSPDARVDIFSLVPELLGELGD
jgi:hypothetical protein